VDHEFHDPVDGHPGLDRLVGAVGLPLQPTSFALEDQRAREAYGVSSGVNNVLVISRATRPGRITAILVNESLGF